MKVPATGVLAASALVLAVSGCAGDGAPPACGDCNVVLISVDTLRADHVGAYGYPKPTTPNIDAFAARGVLFENAISQSSWTRPAHMSIMTGLHPREHGFVALADRRRLDASIPTLASVLRREGFATAAFVGGVNLNASAGFDIGFDVFRNNGRYFRDNLEDVRWWLDHRGEKKFFLFLHGYDAHTPYQNDAVDRMALGLPQERTGGSLATTCREEGPASRVDPFVREYDGAVHRADRYVGKLLAELDERGLRERTIVVLLSDHGEEFLEHGRCFHLATLYREVLHVPLIVSAPGLEPRREPGLVAASVTIAPTIMDLVGIREHPFPGTSLLRPTAAEDAVFSETERKGARGEGHVLAMTTREDKLIHWTTLDRFGHFDTTTDPAERSPLAESAKRQELAARLETWAASHPPRAPSRRTAKSAAGQAAGEAAPAEDDPIDPNSSERLRSLGYAE